MRLSELNPRWYNVGDHPHVGFTFDCPHCLGKETSTRLGVAVHEHGLDHNPEPEDQRVIVAGYVWDMTNGDSWETISLTPSVDASSHGHWHGFIAAGAIVGGLA